MKKIAPVVLVALLLAQCSSAPSAPAPDVTGQLQGADVTGQWQGAIGAAGAAGSPSANVVMILQQRGDRITGQIMPAGQIPSLEDGAVAGTIAGNRITIAGFAGDPRIELNVTGGGLMQGFVHFTNGVYPISLRRVR